LFSLLLTENEYRQLAKFSGSTSWAKNGEMFCAKSAMFIVLPKWIAYQTDELCGFIVCRQAMSYLAIRGA
jgi:hypothetical protein